MKFVSRRLFSFLVNAINVASAEVLTEVLAE